MKPPPTLGCPSCGEPLIAPHGRGRHDDDGNFIEHKPRCRCGRCDWFWWDDAEPVRCECGSLVGVEADGEHAYAREVAK